MLTRTHVLGLPAWLLKPIARTVVLTLVVGSTPLAAMQRAPAADARAADTRAADSRTPQRTPPPNTTPPPPARKVVVNRTVPRVTPPPAAPSFSDQPSDAEFLRARIFPEPLVPVGRPTTATENRALAQALLAYTKSGQIEQVAPILAVFQKFPDSPWRASVLASIGTVFVRTGYLTRALQTWDQAWQLAKNNTEPRARAVADYALGEWLDLMTKLGQVDPLSARLKEIEGRDIGGSAGQKVAVARQGLWILQQHHEDAFSSGALAIQAWLAETRGREAALVRELVDYHPHAEGMSLVELRDLVRRSGLAASIGYRPGAAPPVIPAIVHLKVGHYSALLKSQHGRYLLRDAILGERWISRQALDDESSGYAAILDGALPDGWRSVDPSEGLNVIAHCAPGNPGEDDPGPDPDGPEATEADPDGPQASGPGDDGQPGDPNNGGNDAQADGPAGDNGGGNDAGGNDGGGNDNGDDDDGPTCSIGMPRYNFHPVRAALRLRDRPVGYTPSRGPAIRFRVTYDHRSSSLPQIFTFSNLGPKWEFDWLSYAQESPGGSCGVAGCTVAEVDIMLRGFGWEAYRDPSAGPERHWRSRATLVRTSDDPIRYERHTSDGGIEVFALSDGAPAHQRRVFLTEVIDSQGQHVQLTYDNSFRLVGITDALGQVTTLSYELASDPLKITKVTDPFGRFATFTYNATGQLASITDVIGLTSTFAYETGDFIAALTTPYGTTTFRHEAAGTPYPLMIQATDPLGGTERLEYHYSNAALSAGVSAGAVPTGFDAYNEHLDYYNTLYWNKRAMALYPGDISRAKLTHWLLDRQLLGSPIAPHTSSVKHSVKHPLESRVWYAYPNQMPTLPRTVGDGTRPTKVARVLDDATSQIWLATYNDLGRITSRTDPLGRRTSYTYATNGIDLLEVRQTTGTANELLASFADYTTQHRPETVTDAAGQTAHFTHDAAGQQLTATDALSHTVTRTYDAQGVLQTIAGPVAGAATTITRDELGRYRTLSTTDGETLTFDYDALDRLTRVTYADGGYREIVYDRLDIAAKRDRLGQWTRFFYDPLRHVRAIVDPLGRTTTLSWCGCGGLEAVTDHIGQQTQWERDLEGRALKEIRPDGSTLQYTYDPASGRRSTITDGRGQVTTYTYNVDNSLHQITYANAVVSTSSVTFSYDQAYKRPVTMTDGLGTTTYTYKAVGAFGAGRVATIDGPLASDTVEYAYNAMGRLVERTVNGVELLRSHDALGRVTSETTDAGPTEYAYDGNSTRISLITYPNGQTTTYVRGTSAQNHVLQSIQHRRSNATLLSKYDYTFDAEQRVTAIQETFDTRPTVTWALSYDGGSQLVRATKTVSAVPATTDRYVWTYDGAGNVLSRQVNNSVASTTYSGNRPLERQPGGLLRFAGSVSEPAVVSIQGKPAAVSSGNTFVGAAVVPPDQSPVAVMATDFNGNTSQANFQVNMMGTVTTLSHDDNGNLTNDGAHVFEWDALNRLHSVTQGTLRTDYQYNGRNELIRQVDRDNGVTVATTSFVWCDGELCERRLDRVGSPLAITRLYWSGETGTGGTYFYTRDRLGSVRDILAQNEALAGRYEYDPSGTRTRVEGTRDSLWGFTGHHTTSDNLLLAKNRVYDPTIGRWLTSDPLGLATGTNLYIYADNAPFTLWDSNGMASQGGPWHPPDGVSPGCTAFNDCREIRGKVWLLTKMLLSHQGWDWRNPPPRGGGRHAVEIAELYRALAYCQSLYIKKNCDNPCKDKCQQVVIGAAAIATSIVLSCLAGRPVQVPVP